MFMSNLIPEKRINKNGVAVTKHVRADSKSGQSAKLPVPSVGAVAARAATPALDEAIEQARAYMNSVIPEHLSFSVDDMDPGAAQELERLLIEDSKMEPRSYVISSGIGTALGKDSVEQCVAYMHNITVFAHLITGPGNKSISGYVSGLDYYDPDILQPGQDYLLDVPEENRQKALALMEFTVKANEDADSVLIYDAFMENLGNEDAVVYVKVQDDDLAAYVMDHPEHSDAIREIVEREGKALPVEVIKGRLDHEVQSLRDGFL